MDVVNCKLVMMVR